MIPPALISAFGDQADGTSGARHLDSGCHSNKRSGSIPDEAKSKSITGPVGSGDPVSLAVAVAHQFVLDDRRHLVPHATKGSHQSYRLNVAGDGNRHVSIAEPEGLQAW